MYLKMALGLDTNSCFPQGYVKTAIRDGCVGFLLKKKASGCMGNTLRGCSWKRFIMIDKILAKLAEDIAVEEKATRGPWYEREEYDYYQAGTYLGTGGYKHGKNSSGAVIKLPVDCQKEKAESFQVNVCRIESTNADKLFIAHSRNTYKSRIEALKIALEALGHIIENYAPGSCCDKAFLNEKMDIHLVEVSEFAIKEIAQCLGVETEK